MFDRTAFAAGAASGAVVATVAWLVISWALKTPDPPGRRSMAYDQCLASGRNTIACDALMRVLAAELEKDKREYVKTCVAESKNPDNPFNKIICEGEAAAAAGK